MKYGVIVSRPSLLPYVIPLENVSPAAVTKAVEGDSLINPFFVVDFEAGEILRVFKGEDGYDLTGRATELLGFMTDLGSDHNPEKMEI